VFTNEASPRDNAVKAPAGKSTVASTAAPDKTACDNGGTGRPPPRMDAEAKVFEFDFGVFDFLKNGALRTPSESGASADGNSTEASPVSVSPSPRAPLPFKWTGQPRLTPSTPALDSAGGSEGGLRLGAVPAASFAIPGLKVPRSVDGSKASNAGGLKRRSSAAKTSQSPTDVASRPRSVQNETAKEEPRACREPAWAPVDAFGRPLKASTAGGNNQSVVQGDSVASRACDSDADSLADDDWGRWGRHAGAIGGAGSEERRPHAATRTSLGRT